MFGGARRRRVSRLRGGIFRHEVEEDFRADPHAGSPQTHEEKDKRGEIADTEAVFLAGEVANAEEKIYGQPVTFGNSRAQPFCVFEEKEKFTDSFARGVAERDWKKEKAQEFSDPDSVGNAESLGEREWHTWRNTRCDSVAQCIGFSQKEGSARDDFGRRD